MKKNSGAYRNAPRNTTVIIAAKATDLSTGVTNAHSLISSFNLSSAARAASSDGASVISGMARLLWAYTKGLFCHRDLAP